jgi:hypothetical protein
MRTVTRRTVVDKIEHCKGANPNPPEITDAFLKLMELGYQIENNGKCLLAKLDEYVMLYSRSSNLLQCYYLGFGHCSVTCSLQDFRDADHIILWQEEQKSMELKEIDRLLYEKEDKEDDEELVVKEQEPKKRGGRAIRVSDEDMDEIINLLKQKVSQSEISRRYGISAPSISYYKKKFFG